MIIVIAFITFGIGCFLLGTHFTTNLFKNTWGKWQDVGVLYNSAEYKWFMLQVRLRKNGQKKYKLVRIMKYGDISNEVLNKLDVQ